MATMNVSGSVLLGALLTAAFSATPVAAQSPTSAPMGQSPAGQNPMPQFLTLGEIAHVKFELPDLDGKVFSSEQLKKGKPTVMLFWSMKCPIQKAWEDRLPKLVERYGKQGVQFVMVNSNEANGEIEPDETGDERFPKLRKYLKENKLPYQVLIDRNHVVADTFKALTTPDVFVFDGKGRHIYRGLISNNLKKNKAPGEVKHYLADTLDRLLAGQAVDPFQTKPYGCSIKRKQAGEQGRRGGRRRGGRG